MASYLEHEPVIVMATANLPTQGLPQPSSTPLEPRLTTYEEKDIVRLSSPAVSHHDSTATPLDQIEKDIKDAALTTYREAGDEIYDKFTPAQKSVIVLTLSFAGFLSPLSSTTIFAAVPEVAAGFHTSGTIINLSNALYVAFMGIAATFWGPIGQVFGKRPALLSSVALLMAFSAGSALAPDLASFFVFRILTATVGMAFFIVGSSCVGDIYRPTERATALCWFYSGTLTGPAFGPLLGGVIVTYRSWRDIFWLQTALAGLATVLCFFFLRETSHYRKMAELENLSRRAYAARLASWLNPLRVVLLFGHPNLLFVYLGTGALVWNMYSLLAPIRYVLDPRFNLTSPIQTGLFAMAPGFGYLLGTFVGGRWADRATKRWITRRGHRIPEDRLRSCLVFQTVLMPGCMLLYGWSVEKRVGGIALPVIVMFLQGVTQLFCFPALNAYCLDVMQARSAEAVAGNYLLRYVIAAVGSAVCLPAIDAIGVGWFSTISAALLTLSGGLVWLVATRGQQWRERRENHQLRSEC